MTGLNWQQRQLACWLCPSLPLHASSFPDSQESLAPVQDHQAFHQSLELVNQKGFDGLKLGAPIFTMACACTCHSCLLGNSQQKIAHRQGQAMVMQACVWKAEQLACVPSAAKICMAQASTDSHQCAGVN